MRRRRAIRTLLVFVLLGAVATVLSSWAIHAAYFWRFDERLANRVPPMAATSVLDSSQWDAMRVPPRQLDRDQIDPMLLMAGLRDHPGWNRIEDENSVFWEEAGEDFFQSEQLIRTDCGWPAMGLRQWYYQRDQHRPTQVIGVDRTPGISLRGGLRVWPDPTTRAVWQTRFALPLLPLWPGFLINTLFYALLLFALVRGVRTVRRARRRRRGRCVGCGYSREGLDAGAACPECGAGGVRGG